MCKLCAQEVYKKNAFITVSLYWSLFLIHIVHRIDFKMILQGQAPSYICHSSSTTTVPAFFILIPVFISFSNSHFEPFHFINKIHNGPNTGKENYKRLS